MVSKVLGVRVNLELVKRLLFVLRLGLTLPKNITTFLNPIAVYGAAKLPLGWLLPTKALHILCRTMCPQLKLNVKRSYSKYVYSLRMSDAKRICINGNVHFLLAGPASLRRRCYSAIILQLVLSVILSSVTPISLMSPLR